MTREHLKHLLLSVLIGAAVSFLTTLFQGILDLLHKVGPSLPGIVVGVGRYLLTWRSDLHA